MADSTPTPKTDAAPWGEDFDAERAWRLVENLRAERDGLKAERDELRATRDELQGQLDAATAKAQDAEARATTAVRDLHVYKAMREHDLPEGYEEFLTGDTAEEISERAARLAELKAAAPTKKAGEDPADKAKGGDDKGDAGKSGDDPDAGTDTGRPVPDLTPGHGGDSPAPFDPQAIAKAARAASY